jgi:oligopeptide/dipeptide ABC transporter ATP-binding protein
MSDEKPMLTVEDLRCLFPMRRTINDRMNGRHPAIHAVDAVSFTLDQSEILAVVGESGCGKSTTGRMLVRLVEPTGGSIDFDGQDVTTLSGDALKQFRRKAQIIAQNPFEAFDPRQTVQSSLEQPLRIFGIGQPSERVGMIEAALEKAGLSPAADFLPRLPHELSGGQLQRIATVRVTLLEPKFIVADEPVSMLDVSVRADILNHFLDLRDETGLAILFITHDIAVARYVASRIAVMYLGMFVETGSTDEVIDQPKHPYTRALLSNTLSVEGDDAGGDPIEITGDPPTPLNIGPGCRFAGRCPFVFDRCRTETPRLKPVAGTQQVACHLYDSASRS